MTSNVVHFVSEIHFVVRARIFQPKLKNSGVYDRNLRMNALRNKIHRILQREARIPLQIYAIKTYFFRVTVVVISLQIRAEGEHVAFFTHVLPRSLH